MRLLLLVLAALFVSALAEQRDKWRLDVRAKSNAPIEFLVAVKYREGGVETIHDALFDVSDPDSVNYGKHWKQEAIWDVLNPTADRVLRVEKWLRTAGPVQTERLERGAFLKAKTTVQVAEKLFGVELYEWVHVEKGRRSIRSSVMYQLPEAVKADVDLVAGISDLPMYQRLENRRKPQPVLPSKSNAPSPYIIFSSTTQLFAQFIPICANGKATNTPTNLCEDQGEIITSFNFQTARGPNDTLITNYAIPVPSTLINCTVSDNQTYCLVLLEPVPSFELLNVSLQSVYSSGVNSSWASYAYQIAPTSFITPARLRQHYGVPSGAGLIPHPSNVQSVAEFSDEYFSPEDQKVFWRLMGLAPSNVTVRGPNNVTEPGTESTLDIQWISAMAPTIPSIFWSNGDGFILEWVAALNNDTHPPFVNSVSYGMAEDRFEVFYPLGYMQRCDVEFMKLGLRGVTIVFAAGDAGTTNVGHGGALCTPLHPNYPSSSPYVLSVSATMLTPKTSGVCYTDIFGLSKVECTALGEISMDAQLGFFWTTGGGFSNRSPRQPWQYDAVAHFFDQMDPSLLPPKQYWNQNGRGYPDVSACGHNVLIVVGQELTPVDGTSAAAPIFAGILSLINNQRLHNGKPTLGYFNPALYKYYQQDPSVLYDVVFGSNNDGSYVPGAALPYNWHCPYGFNTTVGWDPVSGLGTPRAPQLFQAFG